MMRVCFKVIVMICALRTSFLYAQDVDRLYDLKVKLKPRVVDSCVYWQGNMRERLLKPG